ncbi:MAG: hypothetical protein K9K64_04060 [Desulfohalobiaceae bacterium]|nr:hypothetical protein [Desulfohalobiaceae bacterium]
MGRSEIRYIFPALGAAIFLSFSVHCLLLLFCLVPGPSDLQNGPAEELIVDLLEAEDTPGAKPEQSAPRMAGWASGLSAETSLPGPDPGKDRFIPEKAQRVRLGEPVDDDRVQKVLKQVEKKIIPIWRQASPPSLGWVRLRMKVLENGLVTPRSITGLQGSPELGAYVLGLLQGVSFSSIPELRTLPTPLVIECFFDVTGKSAEK